jgi:hypothetical protein
MNRNDFLNMIGSTAPVNRSMLGEVYELVDLFPYFQSAHMLLLKGLKDNDDVKFEKQLRSSAIHIADREVLYYLLKSEKHYEPDQKIAKEDNEPESMTVSDLSTETQQTVIESAKNSELLITEIERDNEKPKSEEKEDNVVSTTGHTVLMPTDSESEDSNGVIFLLDENGQTEEEKIFFMDPGFSISEKTDLLELESELSDTGQNLYKPDSQDNISETDTTGSRKNLQAELIDKFITANPRIEPIRDKTSHPIEDLSKPHIEEKGSFITETLARIYINQGYYSKAIEIYEKLSLKFPEKSSYFAAQIEKVKEYIKK